MSTEFLEKVQQSVRRKYATHFEWPDKQIKELGVVKDWLRSMESKGEAEYSNPSSVPNDPPDCVVQDREGREVAVEVVEFVSKEAIEENQGKAREDQVYRDWRPNEVIKEINCIIQKKDGKTFHGGPYAKKILVIFTDEDTLFSSRFEYAKLLPKRSFGPVKQIDEAYFLFSYAGFDEGYPYIKLSLE